MFEEGLPGNTDIVDVESSLKGETLAVLFLFERSSRKDGVQQGRCRVKELGLYVDYCD